MTNHVDGTATAGLFDDAGAQGAVIAAVDVGVARPPRAQLAQDALAQLPALGPQAALRMRRRRVHRGAR